MIINDSLTEKESLERYKIINYAVQCLKIEKTWKSLVEAGIEAILIKGWSAAQYYPNPHERLFVDVDLVVAQNIEAEIRKKLPDLSLEVNVDWHFGARHLDSLSFEQLLKNSILKKCGATDIRTLSDEDHLRVLAVHWLTDGGEFKDKLWDICHLINSTKETFDWDKCLSVVDQKRRRWIFVVLAICEKYFDLKLPESEIFKNASDKKIPIWIIKTIEREWSTENRIIPLEYLKHDKKELWRQIKKRFPPNPIQATVMEQGDFDKYPRALYQAKNIISRFRSAAKKKYSKS